MGHERAQFGTNTNLVKKRVKWYNRESTAETMYEGQPVCYMFDTTTNILGYDKGAAGHPETQTSPTTTAEGYLNEGKFLIVEKPYSDNLQWFAGVVAPGSWCGQSIPATSYKWIEIFIPNGAIMPVRAGVECTVGRTVLAILSDCQYFGHPLSATQGRAVAIADETNSTVDTTNGLVLAKVDPSLFLYQDCTGDSLYYGVGGTAAAASQCPNYLNLETAHTGGYASAVVVKNTCSGTMAATGGSAAIIGYVNISGSITATTSYTRAVLGQLNLSGTINGSNAHLCGVFAQLSGTPTFTACAKVAGLMVDCSLGVNPTAGTYNGIMISNNGANQTQVDNAIEIYGNYGINYLFSFQSCDGITANFISNGGTGGATKGITSGGDWKKIKCSIGGTDYFLIAMIDPAEATFA